MASELIRTEVLAWIRDNNHIYFYYDEKLDGLFITYLVLDRSEFQEARKLWLDFVEKHLHYDIYFCGSNVNYIKNHCEFFGNFGKKKVYKYVR